MIRKRYRSTLGISLASDLLATVGAFFGAWYLRFESGTFSLPSDLDFSRYLLLLPVILNLWPVVFYFHGLYQARRGRSRVDEALNVLIAALLATVLLGSFITLFKQEIVRPDGIVVVFTYSRGFLALFAGLDLVFVLIGRSIIRSILRRVRLSGHNLQRILVLGAGA